jgi:hypothetical protein
MAVHRTKALAAAVLLAGGLMTAVGSGWLAPAGAQQPDKPDDRDARQVLEFYNAFIDTGTPAPQTEFCYYVPKEPPTVAQFEAAVARYTAHFKAEFVGVARLHTHEITRLGARVASDDPKGLAARPQVVEALVFKRAAPPQGKVTLLDGSRDRLVRNALLLDLSRSMDLAVKGDPALKARELEAQIKQLQAQLDEIRKQSRTTAKVSKTDLGIDPLEMMTFLNRVAQQRFGKDARERLQLSVGSDGLSLEGDAEAVKWALDVIRKVTEK